MSSLPALARGFRGRRGSALLIVALLLTVGLAGGGLVLDFTRLVSQRNSLQSRLDALALAAALELDGTQGGLIRARGAHQSAGGHSKVEFATDAAGPWQEQPMVAEAVRLVRIAGSAPATMTLMRAFVRQEASTIWAVSTAEQRARTSSKDTLFPYSVIGAGSAPHFGLRVGARHTLRWARQPSAGSGCEGDLDPAVIEAAAAEATQSGQAIQTSMTRLRDAILWDSQPGAWALGEPVNPLTEHSPAERPALIERVNQDTDAASRTYGQYAAAGLGNGRRIVPAAIRSAAPNSRMVQIGAFLLPPADEYGSSSDQPLCAEYVGSYVQGGKRRGAGETGYYTVESVR
jgi:hypothetical protein